MTTNAPAPGTPPQTPETKPPGKGLAVASLVLGILGPCTAGLGSIIGVILGIVALVRLSKAAAAGGKGLAVAGVVVSGLGILLIPVMGILVAILLPTATRARHVANRAAFTNNLRQLSVASMQYAAEQDGRLPSPEAWPEQLARYLGMPVEEAACAPSDRQAGRAVAMNDTLAGRSLHHLPNPGRTVLFFECRPGAPPAGGPDLLPAEPRYPRGYVIAFCDGHVEDVRPDEVGGLTWRLRPR